MERALSSWLASMGLANGRGVGEPSSSLSSLSLCEGLAKNGECSWGSEVGQAAVRRGAGLAELRTC